MKNMLNLSFILISVIITMGLVHANKPAGQFTPDIRKTCRNKDTALRLFITTLDKCVYECAIRDHCELVNYFSKTKLCALHGSDDTSSIDPQAGKCVAVLKRDIHMDINESDKVCDVDNGKDNNCNVTECRPFPLKNGKIFGNLNSVGSRKKFICDCGYFEHEQKTYAVCQQNGTWDYVPTCTKYDWELLLRGTPGIGKSLYDTWVNQITTPKDTECRDICNTACSAHYKNPKVDQWGNQCWQKIKISFWKDCEEVAFVAFNASGSTGKTSWFSKERIINSSWTDIKTEKDNNHFSIVGDKSRRFYINRKFGKCSGDTGWTLVDDYADGGCPYEQGKRIPQFMYSPTNTYSKATHYKCADVFAIHGHV